MNEAEYFLAQLFRPSEATLFSFVDVLLAMTVTTLLCFLLAYAYRATHRGTSYSQSFLVTMFLMGIATSIVMMIIGSNIARAFSLVGALSIIRFRTAVKDPRDTGFLFAAMIAGMGCGTQFYMPAIALTGFITVLVLLLHHFDYGIKKRLESVIRVTFQESEGARDRIESLLGKSFLDTKLINRILDVGDGEVTNVYIVRPGKNTDLTSVEEGLKGLGGVTRIALYESDQHAPV